MSVQNTCVICLVAALQAALTPGCGRRAETEPPRPQESTAPRRSSEDMGQYPRGTVSNILGEEVYIPWLWATSHSVVIVKGLRFVRSIGPTPVGHYRHIYRGTISEVIDGDVTVSSAPGFYSAFGSKARSQHASGPYVAFLENPQTGPMNHILEASDENRKKVRRIIDDTSMPTVNGVSCLLATRSYRFRTGEPIGFVYRIRNASEDDIALRHQFAIAVSKPIGEVVRLQSSMRHNALNTVKPNQREGEVWCSVFHDARGKVGNAVLATGGEFQNPGRYRMTWVYQANTDSYSGFEKWPGRRFVGELKSNTVAIKIVE